ncbi:MAG: hypothetical protein D6766_08670 [Verrucomicrobia bacterium]|nr:MAG: hypothetical protein D6766_08670 [Verrucomicrobiota bacterium]
MRLGLTIRAFDFDMTAHKTWLGVGCLLAVWLAGAPAWAGEKARLSDAPLPIKPQQQQETLRRQLRSHRFDPTARSSRPSLEAITVTPFQYRPRTPSARARILTPEELEAIDEQRNWLFRSPDQIGLTEENLHRALGIRSLPETEDWTKNRNLRAGAMERRLNDEREKADAERTAEAMQMRQWLKEDGTDSPFFGANRQAPALQDAPVHLEESGLADQTDPALENSLEAVERSMLDFRQSIERLTRGQVFEFGAGAGGSLDPAASLPGLGGPLERVGTTDRLLQKPVESPIGPGLASTLDPVNAYPDLTRQELNPVTPRPGSELVRPSVGGLNALERPGTGVAAGLGGPNRLDPFRQPASNPSLLPSLQLPSTTPSGPLRRPSRSVATDLPLPGRTF